MSILETNKTIVLASSFEERIRLYSIVIEKHYRDVTIFKSYDGIDAFFKISNVPPHVLVVDMALPKKSGIELVESVLKQKNTSKTAIIIVSHVPDQDHFVDEVVTGQVQFLTESHNEHKLNACLAKAFNWIESGDTTEYHLKFLTPKEKLFNEGDAPDFVYILRNGLMKVTKTADQGEVDVGVVSPGEFVGEMAHLTGDRRSATVEAISDCELIQIPMGALDSVLFSKPAWSRSLMLTLSRRLRDTSDALAEMKAQR